MRHLALAVLLASASLATAGIISTDTYKCDASQCLPPTCMCASNSPPGGLTPDQIPQFVLLAHDNALDTLPYEMMMRAIENKTQASGCNVPVTWFAQFYHSDCGPAYKALALGHEVAMQTNRFPPTDPFTATDPNPKYDSKDPKTGKPSVAVEINLSRKNWMGYCNMTMTNMVGYRSINYHNNPPIRKALYESGYLYDATIIERWYTNSPTSPSASQMLWPYTMDYGIPQECGFMGPDIGKCAPGEKYPGLWEVPLYQLQEGEEMFGVGNYGAVDEGMPAVADMTSFLKKQLDNRMSSGRVPLNINAHYGWLSDKDRKVDPNCNDAGCERYPSENVKALSDFVDYALKKPEVRFVTFSDLISWMQDPVPLSKFDEWYKCKVPGIRANLAAVNLPEAEKAKQLGMNGLTAEVAAPTPAPAATEEPATEQPATADGAPETEQPATEQPAAEETPAVAVEEEAPAASTGAPSAPADGASSLSKAVAAAAALLGALLLAL